MNYKLAFALGLIPPGVVGREPVAWLYNGVRLPKLPEWDRETYPYAVIWHTLVGAYILFASKTPCVGTGNTHSMSGTAEITTTSAGLYFTKSYNEADWGGGDEETVSYTLGIANKDGTGAYSILWADYDIVGADGSAVLVSAADPIPVYE